MGARVALVHHWLVQRRGGERCLEALSRLLPGADLFTLVHDPRACPAPPEVARVITSSVQRWPLARRRFRGLAPLFPRLFASLDLSGYDLVVTSDASLAKCVRPPASASHLCYCYSPVRWAWDLREVYLSRAVAAPLRPAARTLLARLRRADHEAAQRVDLLVAPSSHVAERIGRCYGREARVVPPPVDTRFFHPAGPPPGADDRSTRRPYLVLGAAVPYKRFDLALAACARLGRPLVVAGSGPEWRTLRRAAGPQVTFVHEPDDATVRALYQGCRALLFPGEEDFGIVPVEAMACGRPVVAWGRGGASETVLDGITGILSRADERDPTGAFVEALSRFEAWEERHIPSNGVQRACMFSVEAHERAMAAVLAEVMDAAGLTGGGPVQLARGARRAAPGPSRPETHGAPCSPAGPRRPASGCS